MLQVVSSSPGGLEPVFESMLANATRICEASYGTLWLCEGSGFAPSRYMARCPRHSLSSCVMDEFGIRARLAIARVAGTCRQSKLMTKCRSGLP